MSIEAKRILHSTSPSGIELKTVLCRYPRFIHAELMTHRVLSRNASSSRAIPVKRLIDDVLRDTAMPIHWGRNQRGMQADEESNDLVVLPERLWTNADDRFGISNVKAWTLARAAAVEVARAFDAAGYHKQVVNRLLEPFSHINVLITATEWENFFELRDHPDAQPEIQALARAIKAAFTDSVPQRLSPEEWHLPFITDEDRVALSHFMDELDLDSSDEDLVVNHLIKVSVARCARTSYLTHDGKVPEIKQDLGLYDQLVGSRPLHASPSEHQATPDFLAPSIEYEEKWLRKDLHGNFHGWIQARKLIEAGLFT